jgi:hypothetical protein
MLWMAERGNWLSGQMRKKEEHGSLQSKDKRADWIPDMVGAGSPLHNGDGGSVGASKRPNVGKREEGERYLT